MTMAQLKLALPSWEWRNSTWLFTKTGQGRLKMYFVWLNRYMDWIRQSCVYNGHFYSIVSHLFLTNNQSLACVTDFVLQTGPARRCSLLPPPLPQHPGVLRHQQPQEQLQRQELLHHPTSGCDHLHPLSLPQACRCCQNVITWTTLSSQRLVCARVKYHVTFFTRFQQFLH